MKASLKLREDAGNQRPPLLRAKLPISAFNLPFAASVAAGDSSDLSFHLLFLPPSFPSLKLSYHPLIPKPNPNPNLSLTLKSSIPRVGRVSLRLSPNSNSTSTFFSLHLKPQVGDFSLVTSSSSRSPKYGFEGAGVNVRTAVPIGGRAGLNVRWAVRLPEGEKKRSSGAFGRLPYLSLDKISIERLKEVEEKGEGETGKKEWSEKDLEGMRGMCYWMEREIEEMRKESGLMKESFEVVKKRILEGRKQNGNAAGNGIGKRA